MSTVKNGDTVQLKSGGPHMTVQKIGEFAGFETGVKCVWFDGKQPMQQVFESYTLEVIDYSSGKPSVF